LGIDRKLKLGEGSLGGGGSRPKIPFLTGKKNLRKALRCSVKKPKEQCGVPKKKKGKSHGETAGKGKEKGKGYSQKEPL